MMIVNNDDDESDNKHQTMMIKVTMGIK